MMFFECALGSFNFGIYDQLGIGSMKYYYGMTFHSIVLLTNMLIVLNVVIAIMADTYSDLYVLRIGLYNRAIIKAIPSYKNNKYYGAMISAPIPFNILTFFLIPIFCCIKDKTKLKRFNLLLTKLIYLPISIFTSLFFILINILLIPVAYLKTLIHKIALMYRMPAHLKRFIAFVIYLILGLPMLVLC